MSSIQNRHLAVARLLIENGAEVNAATVHGSTALMLAALSGQLKMVELLLANGSEVGAKTADGETALMLAAKNNYWDVVGKLI